MQGHELTGGKFFCRKLFLCGDERGGMKVGIIFISYDITHELHRQPPFSTLNPVQAIEQ
jgi:hypothetical protein